MTSSSYLVYLSDCCHIFLYCRKWLNPGYTRLISSRLRPLKILPISPKAQYIIQIYIYIYSYTEFQVSHQIQGLPAAVLAKKFSL